jgi:curved DNA-binding protein CbpA
MGEKEPYEVLGVSHEASEKEIYEAYRRKAKQYHPDVSEKNDAAERFKKVQKAYESIADGDRPDTEKGWDGTGADRTEEADVVESYPGGWKLSREVKEKKAVWMVFSEEETPAHTDETLRLYLDQNGTVSYDTVGFESRSSAEDALGDFLGDGEEKSRDEGGFSETSYSTESRGTEESGAETEQGREGRSQGMNSTSEPDTGEPTPSTTEKRVDGSGVGHSTRRLRRGLSWASPDAVLGAIGSGLSDLRSFVYRCVFYMLSPFYLFLNFSVQVVLAVVRSGYLFTLVVSFFAGMLLSSVFGYSMEVSLVVGSAFVVATTLSVVFPGRK